MRSSLSLLWYKKENGIVMYLYSENEAYPIRLCVDCMLFYYMLYEEG